MKKIFLLTLFFPIWGLSIENKNEEKKGFYLKQVDYRHRGSVAVSLPGVLRLRLRSFYEYRYLAEKKIIPVKEESK